MPEPKPPQPSFQEPNKKDEGLPEQTEQQVEINKARKQRLLESLKEDGFDLSKESDLEALGHTVVCLMGELFSQKYGLSVSEEYLPVVIIEEHGTPSHVYFLNEKSGSKTGVHGITVRGIDDILNGNILAEEVGHFYRYYFGPDKTHEEITDEFFGFLGKRLWDKLTPELEGDIEALIDGNEQKVISKQQALASKVDLEKIHDWKKLFSMQNVEVRKRFFTPNPDYSGL